jgi:hypothetical protein
LHAGNLVGGKKPVVRLTLIPVGGNATEPTSDTFPRWQRRISGNITFFQKNY